MNPTLSPMTLIAGPCVIEDEGLVMEVATELQKQLEGLPIRFFFKASFDKANRTSIEGFRGPGLEKGLAILEKVKGRTGLPILTDFHTPDQAERVAQVCDFLQIPAFLCRQTDMIFAGAQACLKHKRLLNVKKGQFLAPTDAKNIVEKIRETEKMFVRDGGKAHPEKEWFYLTERGTSFGYHALVVDMTSFQVMHGFGVPTIFDATHSVQRPGAGEGGKSSGGKRGFIEVLARSAMAAGADGLFMECHPRPSEAKSDGPNAFYLEHVGAFVRQLLEFRKLSAEFPKLLPESNLQ